MRTTVGKREQEDRRPAQGLEVESREIRSFAQGRRHLAPGHLAERREAELGAAAQGSGQLDRAVTGEGLEGGVERRKVLAVEGLGPVEVMGHDECHGRVTFWPGIEITMLTRRFLAWLAGEVLGAIGWY